MSKQIISSVTECLSSLIDPYTGGSMTAAKSLKAVEVTGNRVLVRLVKGYPLARMANELSALVQQALSKLPFDSRDLHVEIEQQIVSHSVQQGVKAVDGVKNIIAVASGKGGVGKSTVAANLAVALSQAGASVAVLDADVYGPSQPRMLGAKGKPESVDDKMMLPLVSHGLKIMSIGFMVEEDTPMIWRGPMVTQALEQMLRTTSWDQEGNEVDYMIVDLPPGTGDIQLTLSQRVPVVGAIIVTTPQDVALLDARKAYKMFEKVDIPVFGVIENMSTHICSQCGHEEAIFGSQGAAKMAADYNLELLGDIPLELAIRQHGDAGQPTVIAGADSVSANKYCDIAIRVAAKLSIKKRDFSTNFGEIVVESSA